MNATMAIATTTARIAMIVPSHHGIVPTVSSRFMYCALPVTKRHRERAVDGRREMMFTKRIMEMPLPMPFSLIFSESHMTSAEPAQ